jgi:hypothetical protein
MSSYIVYVGAPTKAQLLAEPEANKPVTLMRVAGPSISVPPPAPLPIQCPLPTSARSMAPASASQMSFGSQTPSIAVEASYNDGSAVQPPDFRFNVARLTPLSQCQFLLEAHERSGQPGKLVAHVLGHVTAISPMETINKKDGSTTQLLKLTISDDSSSERGIGELKVVVWGCVACPGAPAGLTLRRYRAEAVVRTLQERDIVYLSGKPLNVPSASS